MKIAVYTIALNEEQFVQRWAESAKGADYLLIADTGSTDRTIEIAKSLGINVFEMSIKPWRFDEARNTALNFLPKDIDLCIALDMDEVLLPGWREEVEKAYAAGWNRPRYQYTWSWKDDAETIPALQYGGDKIHSRHDFYWKHPVHEVLTIKDSKQEKQGWIGLEIHHHPDHRKSRGQYFPLLKLAVEEDPDDDRNAFYYARELYFNQMYQEAATEFKRHLSLPRAVWRPERAASMRYLAKCEFEVADYWLKKAIEEAPDRREAYVELAQYYYYKENWELVYVNAKCAIAIQNKPLEYLCEEFAWGSIPYDLAAISAYRIGFKDEAIKFNEIAIQLNPEDIRLQNNHKFYLGDKIQ